MERYTIEYGYSCRYDSEEIPIICTKEQLVTIGTAICMGANADWCVAKNKKGLLVETFSDCM